LNAASGFENDGFMLPSLPAGIWSVGSAIALPVFENGLRSAVLERTRSAYEQTRDQYRSVVLTAFGDVEDQLSRGRWLCVQSQKYRIATRAAVHGQSLALQLYTGGVNDYLNVVVQEGYALSSQRAELQANTAQLTNKVDLIRALGGGWSTGDMPQDSQIVPKSTGTLLR
jgi:multidrug efflux system outer membrane protein